MSTSWGFSDDFSAAGTAAEVSAGVTSPGKGNSLLFSGVPVLTNCLDAFDDFNPRNGDADVAFEAFDVDTPMDPSPPRTQPTFKRRQSFNPFLDLDGGDKTKEAADPFADLNQYDSGSSLPQSFVNPFGGMFEVSCCT